jgi:hypothetical protein
MLALERLARHSGITQRAMLERLILAADVAVLAGLTPGTGNGLRISVVTQSQMAPALPRNASAPTSGNATE